MRYSQLSTPLGPFLVAGSDEGLHHASFQAGSCGLMPEPHWVRDDTAFAGLAAQVTAYFAGAQVAFDAPLAPRGTDFQRAVWAALAAVGWGETTSYGDIAARMGQPRATRAVGLANGKNPLPLFVPCHRVIGANGALTGYSGGLWIKERLLAIERGEPQAKLF